jgi:predicted double-glycine peptidase
MIRFIFPILAFLMLSEEELRFANTYKQGYDTSCGIAVTAALLNYYWNIPITEKEIYQDIIINRYHEGELTYTVSFLAITEYLSQKGLQSKAYKMDWDTLKDTLYKGFAPIIIHYNKPNPHFAILVHIYGNYAFVADPSKGFELIDRKLFDNNYGGNALLTASRTANKNIERIEKIKLEETKRLERLQQLSYIKGRL